MTYKKIKLLGNIPFLKNLTFLIFVVFSFKLFSFVGGTE